MHYIYTKPLGWHEPQKNDLKFCIIYYAHLFEGDKEKGKK